MGVILEGKGITRNFGGLRALAGVDIAVTRGEIFGLIGPNGAGKSTLLSVLCGVCPPSSGRVYFGGRDITSLKPHRVCRLGISRVLQTPRPFPSMSVLENVAVGAIFGGRDRLKGGSAVEEADSILRFMDIRGKQDFPVGRLTLQEKKLVEMARALASKPEVLLIDEVMSGLNPTEIEEAMRLVRKVRDELGVTVVWIEHVMRAIMGVAERVMVLDYGQAIALGSPGEVAQNEKVIEAYLGKGMGAMSTGG
ncbi:MAG: ABC transporter ATP-binding protein [Dehalococcoidia bacterium]|nr:ABC transporter ATP-binding protein [Dehalococcoidia bacterium]